MLDSVLDEIIAVLKSGGLNACRAFPEKNSTVKYSPCAVVSAEKILCVSSGFGEYLGVRSGVNGEAEAELYGKRLDCEIAIAVYSPFGSEYGAGYCMSCAERINSAINALKSGVKVNELELGDVAVCDEVSAYCMRCTMSCTCSFIAESSGEDGEFLDFVLKGTVIDEC